MKRNPADYVVINDGQYLYPIRRNRLGPNDDIARLLAMNADEYADWCQRVPVATRYLVGSEDCIKLCQRLLNRGAEEWIIG